MAQRGADPTPALTALRSKGISSASLPTRKRGEALAFAKSWGYDAIVVLGAASIQLIETESETAARCRDINTLVETVSTLLNPENGNE